MLKLFEILIALMCAPFILGCLAYFWWCLVALIKYLFKGDF